MPKRPNPFGESSPLQFKTHVGKKEVDMGVNMEENMQQVYERTKCLLFEGSRKATDCGACHETGDWTCADTRGELRPLPGQLRLDADGHLQPQTDVVMENGTSACDPDPETNGSAEVEMDAEVKVKTPVKQLLIDSSGRLCSQLTESSMSGETTSSGCRICHSCNHPFHLPPRTCNFCDKSTCSNCLHQCQGCQGLYCQLCCLINYDDNMERPFCLQCSG